MTTHNFLLSGDTMKRDGVEFFQYTSGEIKAEAVWEGSAKVLSLILEGPGPSKYVLCRQGPSPLSLAYTVSEEEVRKGHEWRVCIVDESVEGIARGTLNVTFELPVVTAIPLPEKTITVKNYEILSTEGFTPLEIKGLESSIKHQRSQAMANRMAKRIQLLENSNPLASILLPIIIQRMEEKSATPTLVEVKVPETGAEPATETIDVSPYLTETVNAFRSVPADYKNRFLLKDYMDLAPGERPDTRQLGGDLLNAIRPNFKSHIRELVAQAFDPQEPKYNWDSSALPANLPEVEPFYRTGSGGLATPEFVSNLSTLIDKLKPEIGEAKDFKNLVENQGYEVKNEVVGTIYESLKNGLFTPDPVEIPDLNSEHSVRNHYQYLIELDWFQCLEQNERYWFIVWTDDEPYWHISATIPTFDANDPECMQSLKTGALYEVESQTTDNYEDVNNGETRRFRAADRWWLHTNTYHTTSTITLQLWENDFSKDATKKALKKVMDDLEILIVQEIRDAVMEALEEALLEALVAVLPDEVESALRLFFAGEIDFVSLMESIDLAVGGINIGVIVLELLFSGKSLLEIIQGIGGACPELTLILMAIKVGGSIVIDLLEGDFGDALKGLLTLPLKILEFIADFFTDILDLVRGLLAWVNPDDHIETRSITIDPVNAIAFADAVWGDGYVGQLPQTPEGCGPTSNNSSLYWGSYLQPYLLFSGDDAKYKAYFNVKRVLAGGVETFGYSVNPIGEEGYFQKRSYVVKTNRSRANMKVKVAALNSQYVPLVNIAGYLNMNGEHEFEVTVRRDDVLELSIVNFSDGPFYGFVTLEEIDYRS